MKSSAAKVATLLLVCALALLVLAELMGAKGGWAWLKAGAEAAAVGAIADWFAVVVLFRHPLGIKLPHTAIIPRRKDRIADSLANFVHNHFLQPQQLVFKLQQMNVAEQVSQWLLQDNQREQLVKQFQLTLKPDPKVAVDFQIYYEQVPLTKERTDLVNQTIGYYQTASDILKKKKYQKQ